MSKTSNYRLSVYKRILLVTNEDTILPNPPFLLLIQKLYLKNNLSFRQCEEIGWILIRIERIRIHRKLYTNSQIRTLIRYFGS